MRSLTTLCVVAASTVLAACSHDPKPKPTEPLVVTPQPTPQDDAAAPVEQGTPEAGATAAPASASASASVSVPSSSGETIVAGTGRCTKDDDCVVTTYQSGCCTQGCFGRAENRAALAKEMAKEDCSKHSRLCPPPAPCPRHTFDVVRAVCQNRVCASVRHAR